MFAIYLIRLIGSYEKYPHNLLIGELASSRNHGTAVVRKGMLGTAYGICREEGVLKLWQGISPSLTRHVIYSGVRITVYEKLRESVMKHNSQISKSPISKDDNISRANMTLHQRIICGMASGAIGQLCASPADLVKVKMQMQGRNQLIPKTNAVKNCDNMFQIFLGVIRKGGIGSLWKGIIFAWLIEFMGLIVWFIVL